MQKASKTRNIDFRFSEEVIPLQGFHTSEALKTEIGHRIDSRRSGNWDFVQLNSRGPFLYLVFKQKV